MWRVIRESHTRWARSSFCSECNLGQQWCLIFSWDSGTWISGHFCQIILLWFAFFFFPAIFTGLFVKSGLRLHWKYVSLRVWPPTLVNYIHYFATPWSVIGGFGCIHVGIVLWWKMKTQRCPVLSSFCPCPRRAVSHYELFSTCPNVHFDSPFAPTTREWPLARIKQRLHVCYRDWLCDGKMRGKMRSLCSESVYRRNMQDKG